MANRIGAVSLLLLVALVASQMIGHAHSQPPPAQQKDRMESVAPGYQFILGRNEEDLFFVFNPSTGQCWGYTSRGAFGHAWVDYGSPIKKAKPSGDNTPVDDKKK